jgi:hypothetical protein
VLLQQGVFCSKPTQVKHNLQASGANTTLCNRFVAAMKCHAALCQGTWRNCAPAFCLLCIIKFALHCAPAGEPGCACGVPVPMHVCADSGSCVSCAVLVPMAVLLQVSQAEPVLCLCLCTSVLILDHVSPVLCSCMWLCCCR